MPNIGDYHYGFHCGAKQLKNVADMFVLIKFLRSRNAYREEKPLFVQGNNYCLNSSNEHLL